MPRSRVGRIRSGSEVSPEAEEEFQERRLAYAVLTTNAHLTKILRDGKVEVVPTSEIYAVEPDEREGIEVDDPTVTGPLVAKSNIFDRAEYEFNMGERGDGISRQHATGAAGPIAREAPPSLQLKAGSFEEKQEQDKAGRRERAAGKSAQKVVVVEEEEEEGDFDPNNPRATLVSELEDAIANATVADVKKAMKIDDRAGAQKIYERWLEESE